MTMEEVSKMFKIDRKTIYWWRKRREGTGTIFRLPNSHKIKDLDGFVKFLDENQEITVEKIIEKFGNMCKDTVYNYLKKVNYTYKKNFSLSGKE